MAFFICAFGHILGGRGVVHGQKAQCLAIFNCMWLVLKMSHMMKFSERAKGSQRIFETRSSTSHKHWNHQFIEISIFFDQHYSKFNGRHRIFQTNLPNQKLLAQFLLMK